MDGFDLRLCKIASKLPRVCNTSTCRGILVQREGKKDIKMQVGSFFSFVSKDARDQQ